MSNDLELMVNAYQTMRQMALAGSVNTANTDIWQVAGYEENITPEDYYKLYSRLGVAGNGCDMPVNTCWVTAPKVCEKEESEEPTAWDKEFKRFAKKLSLWNRLSGVDRRQRVGNYAGLIMFVADNKQLSEELEAGSDLVAIRPYYQTQLKATEWDQNPSSERYGEPTMYMLNENNIGDRNLNNPAETGSVHWTRVIPWSEGSDDGSIYGTPALEKPFNALVDLEKIRASGGVAFFKNAKNAPAMELDKDLDLNNFFKGLGAKNAEEASDKLGDKWKEYNEKLNTSIAMSGVTFKQMPVTLPTNPEKYEQIALNDAAAGFGVPVNVLVGTQTGVLAGDKDSKSYLMSMSSRRENYLNSEIEKTIEIFVKYGFLSKPSEIYITWTPLTEQSFNEKMEGVVRMADANQKQVSAQNEPPFDANEIREQAGLMPKDDFDVGGEEDK